ncbi:COQ9 family protein [Radicibacter daui]|uniref:COQ9 family protein n=1 Tax=Radicibacter daui TaxID=3064829 RepID=UPI004046DAB9
MAELDLDKLAEAERDAILEATLPNVLFDGWSEKAMMEGAVASGRPAEAALAEFPAGAIDMIAHFSDWADRKMIGQLEGNDLAALKVRQRVALAVRTRLEVLEPHKDALRAAFARLALPFNAPLASKLVWKSCDAIWWLAGDTATDFNHYTKRALLAGVITSTTLYWLDDASEGHADSWQFLDRRIADVLKIGGTAAKVLSYTPDTSHLKRFLPDLPSPARFFRALKREERAS